MLSSRAELVGEIVVVVGDDIGCRVRVLLRRRALAPLARPMDEGRVYPLVAVGGKVQVVVGDHHHLMRFERQKLHSAPVG